jgi:hypothetical protein
MTPNQTTAKSGAIDERRPLRRITARRLGNAVLLTHESYGHVSLVDPSACVQRAITSYRVGLVTPRRGTVCQSNHQPFDPHFGEPPAGEPIP